MYLENVPVREQNELFSSPLDNKNMKLKAQKVRCCYLTINTLPCDANRLYYALHYAIQELRYLQKSLKLRNPKSAWPSFISCKAKTTFGFSS
jgi:hypothetical protein